MAFVNNNFTTTKVGGPSSKPIGQTSNVQREGGTFSVNSVFCEGANRANNLAQADGKKQTDETVDVFKKLDKDGDLKVSAQEYTDNIVAEYMNNGGELPLGYNNIADFIADKFAEFKQFAGDDNSMNIDEFRSMVEARLTGSEASKPESSLKPESN